MSNDILSNMKQKMKRHQWIVAAGVDTPELEKLCHQAGCDMILLYPTAKYQNASNRFLAGYLSFGNTNDMMDDMAYDFMALMNNRRLMAGLNGSDPFKNDDLLLKKIKEYGFTGIHNYPTMALVDGTFGMNLDNLKAGFDKEITLLKKAKDYGFYTCGMVRTAKQAIQLVRNHIDILIFYVGLGEHKEKNLDQIIRKLKELTDSVRKLSKDLPLLFYCEQLTSVNEIASIAKEVKELNGYFFLPIAKKNLSKNQLQLEIKQSIALFSEDSIL